MNDMVMMSKKIKHIQLRVSEKEFNILSEMSQKSNQTKSDIIRNLLLNTKQIFSDEIYKEMVELRRDLNSGLGKNLSQIANEFKNENVFNDKEFENIVSDFKKFKKRMNKILNKVEVNNDY